MAGWWVVVVIVAAAPGETRGEAPAPPPPPPLHLDLLAHGGFSGAFIGTPEPAFGLTTALDSEWLRGQLTVLFLPPMSKYVGLLEVDHFALGGRVDVLAQFRPALLITLAAGPSLTILAMPLKGIPYGLEPDVALIVAPALWAQVRLNFGAWRVALEGGPQLHLVRQIFDTGGGAFGFRFPLVFASLGISVGRAF